MANLFMKIITPIIIIKTPLVVDIIGKYFENFLNCLVKVSMAIAVNINGTASPSEYITNSKTPVPIEFMLVAYISIEDNIGPMQGVQPEAKAIPMIMELKGPVILSKRKNLVSR